MILEDAGWLFLSNDALKAENEKDHLTRWMVDDGNKIHEKANNQQLRKTTSRQIKLILIQKHLIKLIFFFLLFLQKS